MTIEETNQETKIVPIRPKDIAKHKKQSFPSLVIKSFNELIIKDFTSGHAVVFQDEVSKLIAEKMGCSVEHVFNNGWLNVEEIFIEAGWEVYYEKPAYNEVGRAFYRFYVNEF